MECEQNIDLMMQNSAVDSELRLKTSKATKWIVIK